MPEAFLTLLFGLLGDFTFCCYKLCCTAILLQCMRPWASNERRLERKALWRKEQPVFWRMTFRAVAMLTGTHSSWLTMVETEVLKCMYLGRVCLFQSVAQTRLSVLTGGSVGSPWSQSQVGDEKQQVTWHWSMLPWEGRTFPSLEIFKIWLD